SRAFLAALSKLSPEDGGVVLRMLAAAAVLDGRLVRAEERLLSEAYRLAHVSSKLDSVKHLRKAFVRGEPISAEDLRATG
ncbi:MAG TPA: hypothetical protein VHU80_12930, partial [Polyangiaceae bacterium]|nr:hypothetical protein [Polyangiaceae bacterium]